MIVDDSAVARGLVTRWLSAVPDISVVCSKRTGREAVQALNFVDPDVIILDIEMPDMDGLTALPLILAKKPDASVIMASTLTRRGAEISLKALSLGARDCISKPEASRGLPAAAAYRHELVEKVRVLGKCKQVPGPVPPVQQNFRNTPIQLVAAARPRPTAVLLGSSTGGPPALMAVMKVLGQAVADLPILIAQHMPPTFTGIMAEHLGRAAGIPAAEGQDGEAVLPGRIYVAPGGRHMRVALSGGKPIIRLDDGPQVNFCRPAVDPLFKSAAEVFGAGALAIILTGMGQDGAAGASAIAAAGGTVIAQDEATSVVWGMPGAAARSGVCAAVLPLDEIGPAASKMIKGAGA